MLQVRTKAKFDFNLWVDISRINSATASKLYVILRLKLSKIFPKSGVRSKSGIEMLKNTTNARFGFNF